MRILLCDDSISTARQLTQLLKQLTGHEVVGHAKNGAEGVRMFNELSPDVVLMDLVMPLMDGLQATRAIVAQKKDAKIIVVSSIGGSGDKAVEALRCGAQAVLSKPFELEPLRQALSALS